MALATVVSLSLGGLAFGKDDDDSGQPAGPVAYLDIRSSYTRLPAGVLGIGFSNPSAVVLPTSLSLSLPASQGLGLDLPLTIDLNDRVTVYGGVTASTTKTGDLDWSSPSIASWNIGFQADVWQQNGGAFPTVTVQSTLTRSATDSPFATTTLNSVVEAGYALDTDETRGLLAGVQLTNVSVDSDLAAVRPNLVGYLGGYYQWDNNWKLSGRAGVQSFGGAQLLSLPIAASFTQPILRIDLDRMDDHDNRLFGITTQIAWTPKPTYQLIVRTPLYMTAK
ncbi:MAG: hypothetical protein HXX15_11945 [Rhodopseudomonas sp.]|nr:hypothetical protein [Rhodopseudomonas sp.]